MDWNKCIVLGLQAVVVVVLGVLVALGHDGPVLDGLLAACGSVFGVGAYQTLVKKAAPPADTGDKTESGTG